MRHLLAVTTSTLALVVVLGLAGCGQSGGSSGGSTGSDSSSGGQVDTGAVFPAVTGNEAVWVLATACPLLEQGAPIAGTPLIATFSGGAPGQSSGCSYRSDDNTTNVLVNAHFGSQPQTSEEGPTQLVEAYGRGALFRYFPAGESNGTAACIVSVPIDYETGDYLLVRVDSGSIPESTLCAAADQILRLSAAQAAPEVGPAGATCDLLAPVQDQTGGADVEAVLTSIANTYFGGDFNAMYIWAANECGVAFE